MFNAWLLVNKEESKMLQEALADEKLYIVNNRIKYVYEVYRDAIYYKPAIYILEIPVGVSRTGYSINRLREIDTQRYEGGPKKYWEDFCKKEEAQRLSNEKSEDDMRIAKARELAEILKMDSSSNGKLFYNLGSVKN